MCCSLCNEPFNLFEFIVLPLLCETRDMDAQKLHDSEYLHRHFFHVCCIDIIHQENTKEDGSEITASKECIVCTTKADNKADEWKDELIRQTWGLVRSGLKRDNSVASKNSLIDTL